MLISSGLGSTFPPHYPVATITKVERPPGEPFAAIEAMPLARLDKSREVLLVWLNTPELEHQTFDFDNALTGEASDQPAADPANDQAIDQANNPENNEQGAKIKNEGVDDPALSGDDTSE